jgi:hypothetical protein
MIPQFDCLPFPPAQTISPTSKTHSELLLPSNCQIKTFAIYFPRGLKARWQRWQIVNAAWHTFMDRKSVQFIGFITPALIMMSPLTLFALFDKLFTLSLRKIAVDLVRTAAPREKFKTANVEFIVFLVIELNDKFVGNEKVHR